MKTNTAEVNMVKKITKNKILKKKLVKITKKVIVKKPAKKIVKKVIKKININHIVRLKRHEQNPIMSPSMYQWESEAVFNPAAVYHGGWVHLFYRAMGPDGVSRIGYAKSKDGINFKDRLFYPVYFAPNVEQMKKHWPYTSPARPVFDRDLYSSGGGWGGCEDPRAVVIDGILYMTFNMFNGWHSMRVAVTTIREQDLLNHKFVWKNFNYLTKEGDRQKNWVLFPEKINGKFVIFHNLDMNDNDSTRVGVAYVDELDSKYTPYGDNAPDPQKLPDRIVSWHKRTRSASAPPIKTKEGWLLLYHAMDKDGSDRYKLGAMLLDLKNPSKIIARAMYPILEPEEWYENDYKPGIIYASGAVIKDDKLLVYYGGGDKHIGVASVVLKELLDSIKTGKNIKLKKIKNFI
ncbi:MAG: hypothetical protein M3P22_01130 [bacterium]|nr:hypothetical protein [bacterium]